MTKLFLEQLDFARPLDLSKPTIGRAHFGTLSASEPGIGVSFALKSAPSLTVAEWLDALHAEANRHLRNAQIYVPVPEEDDLPLDAND